MNEPQSKPVDDEPLARAKRGIEELRIELTHAREVLAARVKPSAWSWLRSVAKHSAEITVDIAGIGGGVLISIGAWMIYRPAGFVVAGVLMLAGSILIARAPE